jgi:hypothetical protein
VTVPLAPVPEPAPSVFPSVLPTAGLPIVWAQAAEEAAGATLPLSQ